MAARSKKLIEVDMLEDLEPDRQRAPNTTRQRILERIQKRRNDGASPEVLGSNDGPYGYSALNIPLLDYQILIHRFPELNSKDAETQRRAWQRFCRDDASELYRVDASVGQRPKNNHRIHVK